MAVIHSKKCIFVFQCVLWIVQVSSLNPEDKSNLHYRDRDCTRAKWKGDIGGLQDDIYDYLPRHPRNIQKISSRKKRFVSFPKGSSLTINNELEIPKMEGDRKALSLFLALPFTLDLPEGKLKLSPIMDPMDYAEIDAHYNFIRIKRNAAINRQRKSAFSFIERTLNKFGLPGKLCLLKAVCQMAEEPVHNFGVIGELLSLLFSASFGENNFEMKEYIEAEAIGRRNGSCLDLYSNCSIHLLDFLESGLSIVHSGFVSASYF